MAVMFFEIDLFENELENKEKKITVYPQNVLSIAKSIYHQKKKNNNNDVLLCQLKGYTFINDL